MAKFEVKVNLGTIPKDGDKIYIEIPDSELEGLEGSHREDAIQEWIFDEVITSISWDYREIVYE